MTYKEYEPNPVIVDHAVELWVNALYSPVYDNGDKSGHGALGRALAEMIPKNNTPEILNVFGEELRKILMEPFTYTYNDTTWTRIPYNLSVDYHPCVELQTAADRAGLKMEFPWKTDMYLEENYLSWRCGYYADRIYHYPLKSGKWLETTLCGTDITKIIELINVGVLNPNLTSINTILVRNENA